MTEFFLPVLSHFLNGNPWTGSDGRLRYKLVPTPPETEDAEGILTAQVWEGPWAYEFSTVEETKTFPLSTEGLDQLPLWLNQWSAALNARPKRSLEEDIARRKEPSA